MLKKEKKLCVSKIWKKDGMLLNFKIKYIIMLSNSVTYVYMELHTEFYTLKEKISKENFNKIQIS